MSRQSCNNAVNALHEYNALKKSIVEHSAPCRPRTGGKSIFYFSFFRGEIVSSSINGGCGGGRKTMLKISPNWNPRHYFSSPTSAGSVGAKGRRRRRQKDDPNMAAQTEYKNARSLARSRGTNELPGWPQSAEAISSPTQGCPGNLRWVEPVALLGGTYILIMKRSFRDLDGQVAEKH